MGFPSTKTHRAGASIVVLLLSLPLLAGVMPGTAFARTRPYLGVLAAEQERMVGVGRGVLEARHGCVVLEDALRKPTLVVFPPGYTLTGARKMKVRDETGARVASLGRTTTLDGGYAGQYQGDEEALEAILASPIPDRCQYGYVFFGY